VLGVVGESGAGKSVTGLAVIGLIDPPGRIAGGEIYLVRPADRQSAAGTMRDIRGRRIGMIFQDPLTSLNPLYGSAISWSRPSGPTNLSERREARERAIDLARPRSAFPRRTSASTPIRTNSPAACASAS
jgi:peptide/nickel transport system ATP-binding protein